MKCKICESDSREFGQAQVLGQYAIAYFQCSHCRFVQTQEPYWLAEAYGEAIARSDEGLVFRNLMLAHISSKIITKFFKPDANFLDYGGGYGLFSRLMRDIRFKFDWHDPFSSNLFAKNFPAQNQPYELVTAFEVFEHFPNPITDLSKILKFSRNILFSTELLPIQNPPPGKWWYYAPDQGQHISFYTPQALSILAQKLNLNFYSNGSSLHLFTEKNLPSEDFCQLAQYHAEELRRFLSESRNYLKTLEKIEQNTLAISRPKITVPLHPHSIPSIKGEPTIDSTLGVNIAGYINGEFGIGEGVRATIRSLEAAGIPFALNNFTLSPHRKLDTTYQNFTQDNPYPINLIQINADEVKNFIKYTGAKYLENRYNIGFWAWELPTFPSEWTSVFSHFHEIWTYSNHCAEAITKVSPIPVIKMMPSIALETPILDREALKLPKNKFIFLFIFDFFSRSERKNPLGIIEAFKKAFNEENFPVFLIIKSSNSEHFPEQQEQLKNALENCPNIKQIDGYLSKAEINALLYNCDCYISLHRSEGFGLTMAEAMFYGKPVIATGYSSNTEFMNLNNSFLVKYKLEAIASDFGPYKQGNIWAEPDINHAAFLMRSVFNNYQQGKQVGARAAQDIQSLLNPQSVGNQIKKRLEYISQLTQNFTILPAPQPSSENLLSIVRSPQEDPLKEQPANSVPLVSICIPTYNGEAFLADALQSAFSQTYPNLEIIVSDDGSTDKTVEIAQSFRDKNSLDYRIILHRNYGLGQNWNFCISQAQGQYIKFLFQDDLLEPDCITQMVRLAIQDREIGLVFSPREIIMAEEAESNPLFLSAYQSIRTLYKNWSNLKPIQSGKELLSDPFCLQNPINKIGEPTTVLIAGEVFRKIGLFDTGLSQYLDLDMWFRIMGHYKIGFVDRQLSGLRLHAGQQTWKNYAAGESRQDIRRLYSKMLNSPIYSFLTQEFKDRVREKLEGKSQKKFPLLNSLLNQYKNFSPTSVNDLRQARQQIAEAWLNLPAQQWESAYLGELGEAHQQLIKSGIKCETLTAVEQSFVDRIASQLSQGIGVAKAIHYHLAAMLYRDAYQLPIEYRNAAIPRWFIKDFLKFLFEAPNYFQEKGEVEKYRHYLQEAIDYIHQNLFHSPSISDIWRYLATIVAQNAILTPLLLSESNLQFREVSEKLAHIREFALKEQGLSLEFSFRKKNLDQKKIRLGILLENISDRRETFATIPLLNALHPTQFEIILYQVDLKELQWDKYCQNQETRLVQLPESLSEQVDTIRHDDLDILLIALNLTSVPNSLALLCLHRLARVQVTTSATTLATTGASHIDYHIIGNLTLAEPQAQQQYGEKLLTLEGSGLCFSYPETGELAKVQPTRQSWGASEDSTVFFSAANFSKIIPEQRETWAKILATVPKSILVLCPFRPYGENYPAIAFLNQMRSLFAELSIDKKRIVVIKALPSRADLQECLKLADIYLDSFPHTSAASLIEPLLTGVPTIVREGNTARERQAAAIARELGVPELIANSENSYIELSTALGTNPELRQQYRQQILQKMAGNPRFLDSRAYCAQLEPLLKKIFRE